MNEAVMYTALNSPCLIFVLEYRYSESDLPSFEFVKSIIFLHNRSYIIQLACLAKFKFALRSEGEKGESKTGEFFPVYSTLTPSSNHQHLTLRSAVKLTRLSFHRLAAMAMTKMILKQVNGHAWFHLHGIHWAVRNRRRLKIQNENICLQRDSNPRHDRWHSALDR